MTKWIATFDLHWGYEKTASRHRRPLHLPNEWDAIKAFAQDFKPDLWINGGDMVNAGMVSHHTEGDLLSREGERLGQDLLEFRLELREERKLAKRLVYIPGNHEDWIEDFRRGHPSVEDLLEPRDHLGLEIHEWIPFGKPFRLGKLIFVHGHNIRSAAFPARTAVMDYERSVRFGHFHTYEVATKNAAVDEGQMKTGVAVPCICRRDVMYGEGKPNKWIVGFNFGYMDDDGSFTDFVAIIVNRKFAWNGKVYRG